MARVRTSKGKVLDLGQIWAQNQKTVAVTLGGKLMNARGDILGPGGKIIKTAEEIAKEYNRAPEHEVRNVSLSDRLTLKDKAISSRQADVKPLSGQPAKVISPAMDDFDEVVAQQPAITENIVKDTTTKKKRRPGRKLVDSE